MCVCVGGGGVACLKTWRKEGYLSDVRTCRRFFTFFMQDTFVSDYNPCSNETQRRHSDTSRGDQKVSMAKMLLILNNLNGDFVGTRSYCILLRGSQGYVFVTMIECLLSLYGEGVLLPFSVMFRTIAPARRITDVLALFTKQARLLGNNSCKASTYSKFGLVSCLLIHVCLFDSYFKASTYSKFGHVY